MVRGLLLPPFPDCSKPRGRRDTLDVTAVQPIGNCVSNKSERHARNYAARVVAAVQASSRVADEKLKFFVQRMTDAEEHATKADPVPQRWRYLNNKLRDVGLPLPVAEWEPRKGSKGSSQESPRGPKGYAGNGRGTHPHEGIRQ